MKMVKKLATKKVAAKKSAAKKEMATKKKSEVALSEEDYLVDAEKYSTKVDKDDVLIPRIAILQTLSKALDKTEAAFIKGAEVGQFCDASQNKLWDGEEGIVIIPVHYRKTNIEWKKRQFVADRGLDIEYQNSCKRNEKGKLITPDGNTLVPTAEYAVLIVEDGGFSPAMISMTGSQMKKSKKLMTMITNFLVDSPRGKVNPAMFYRSYKITTQPESNDEGSWFGFGIEVGELTPKLKGGKDIYLAARAFRKQMDEGSVKVQDHATEGEAVEDDESPM